MRLFALIGILILLFAPFTYTRITVDLPIIGESTTNVFSGYFWVYTNVEDLDPETDTFETDWIEENNVYEGYFGEDFRLVGLAIFVLLFVGLAFAILDSDSKRSTYILLICGVALLILRFLDLNDDETFFYDDDIGGLGIATYLEIPMGFIFSLIFGLIDRGKN